MSSRVVDPAMRARSPHYYDDSKRPPPSPSTKAQPPKKADPRSPPPSEEPSSPSPKTTEHGADPDTDKSKGIIDMSILGQIIDLDDDDDHEFSRAMVGDYREQVKTTFKDMDDAFTQKDLRRLGRYGHFLKGSSAALGVVKVQEICEKIQLLGNGTEATLSGDDALARIKPLLARVKDEYATAEKLLTEYCKSPDS
ncbi:histidine-phosphotransfer domain HPT domain-containing protein [Phlebopus sp. FC_14]|nr:histidine-phosphotransfer domain HPT domain-containing protein [Phlebopus sp. FC_14]